MTEDVGTQTKKGLPTLAWIGIGCAVLVVIMMMVLTVGGLFMAKKVHEVAGDLDFDDNPAMAAARLIVRMNPELEEVAVDEEAGTMTVRHTKSGETVTVNFEDISEGRFSFTTDEGEVTIEASGDPEDGQVKITSGDETWSLKTGVETTAEVPDWVPVYPGAEPEATHVVDSDDRVSGGFQVTHPDGVDDIVGFYRERLEQDGFEVRVNGFESGEDRAGGVVYGSSKAAQRTVTVMVRPNDDGSTRIAVSFQEGVVSGGQ